MPESREIPGPDGPAMIPGQIVAGFRLVRQLAGKSGTTTWLARSEGQEAVTAILTVHPENDALRRRVNAHARVRSPHVLALLDVATTADGLVVLVSERTDWSLSTLLARRGALAAGEAVTVLAPLAAGVAAIHAAGLVHGRLTAAEVVFTSDGRPVIGGLDALHPDAARGAVADGIRRASGTRADYAAVGTLIRSVATVVEEPFRPAFVAAADWLDSALDDDAHPGSLPGQLECRIFAVAPALPLVLVADPQTAVARDAAALRTRSASLPGIASVTSALTRLSVPSRAAGALRRFGVPEWSRRVLRGRALLVCLALAVVLAGVPAGLAAIPAAPQSRVGQVVASARPASSPAPSRAGTRAVSAGQSAAMESDDATVAVAALLEVRADCALESPPGGCADRYAEVGSAVDDADRHAMAQGDRSGMLLVEAASRTRIERVQDYGDAVLVRAVPADEKRQPVLVLVVRTDTGWRLRDVFEPD